MGVADSTARLVAVTPSLRSSWIGGVLLVLVLAQIVAHSEPVGVALYLALAPVLPAISVAAAFGGRADPTREMASASPYPMLQLLILRTVAVVGATVLPAMALALLLPGSTWLSLGWLLPSLALAAFIITLPDQLAVPAAGTLSAAWMGMVSTGWLRHSDPYAAVTPAIQFVSLVALTFALVVLLVRTTHPQRRIV
ncbi:hypothetical protein GCM10022234_23060 [Aeromicrobium panaciterrae]